MSALTMSHFAVSASVVDGVVRLEQPCGHDEQDVIELAADQLLSLADKLRGIVRPDPEAETSRKLMVLAERMDEIVCDPAFRKAVIDGSCGIYTDYIERLEGLALLANEYAYGLQAVRGELPPVLTGDLQE